jgi:hypothetical protein
VPEDPPPLENFCSVRDWCIRNDAPYRVVVPAKTVPFYLPRTDELGFGASVPLAQPEIYLAEVSGATVTGGTGVVRARDEAMLFDMACCERSERYDLGEWTRPWDRAVGEVAIEAGILLQSQYAVNYSHWLIEHVARLLSLGDTDLPLLVDARAMKIPQLAEALAAATGRMVIPLGPELYRVEHLVIPGQVAWMPPNLRAGLDLEIGDVVISREAVQFLRETLGHPGEPRDRLFVYRQPLTAPVRLANAAEVAETFASLGFTIVRPETLSFAQERELFSTAAVVAGEGGSGLMNMLWAPTEAVMVCLSIPAQVNFGINLVNLSGQRAISIHGPITERLDSLPYQSKFEISPDAIREAVSWLGSETA